VQFDMMIIGGGPAGVSAALRARELGATVALVERGQMIVDHETHQILGGHVVGEQAVEVVQLLATGITAGLRIEQLADLELAYPTFTAIVGIAARQIVRELDLQPVAHGWRGLRPIRILPEEEEIPEAA